MDTFICFCLQTSTEWGCFDCILWYVYPHLYKTCSDMSSMLKRFENCKTIVAILNSFRTLARTGLGEGRQDDDKVVHPDCQPYAVRRAGSGPETAHFSGTSELMTQNKNNKKQLFASKVPHLGETNDKKTKLKSIMQFNRIKCY